MRTPLALACFGLLSLGLLSLAGCAAQESKPASAQPPAATAAAQPAPDDSLYATLWQQGAIEHDLVYLEIYRDAQAKLLHALRDPHWDALPRDERDAVRHGSLRGLKPAVVLDIDETVLDNSPFQARQVRSGATEFDRAGFNAWLNEASAQPLPGALEFTRFAAAHGVQVIFISNRTVDFTDATVRNLKRDGFPVIDAGTVLNHGTPTPGCEAKHGGKGCRRELVARKYRVLMEFGDQLGDFLDIAANTTDGRIAAVAPYRDWIGERWFVLPNPVYGSWLDALDGDAKTPADRRAAEHASLKTQ
ncbi:MAG TPA: HAD family acid phosphatase [Rhodanobacteraceae bacterium]|nr:HAD family acid phosphatase [Rhodanobacteraceae bacterium]